MNQPMRPNTLRTGKRVYNGTSYSPNFKGVTAVRPREAMKDLKKRNLKNAIGRRLGI